MSSENEFSGRILSLPPETFSFLSGLVLSVMYTNLHFRDNRDRAAAVAGALSPWVILFLVGMHFQNPELTRMGLAGLAGFAVGLLGLAAVRGK